jgi:hypothetical protein
MDDVPAERLAEQDGAIEPAADEDGQRISVRESVGLRHVPTGTGGGVFTYQVESSRGTILASLTG